jgi:hypothetical protein
MTNKLSFEQQSINLQVARKAPQFLNENGAPMSKDELATLWGDIVETFSRLHGQRLIEVMKHIFKSMPNGEKIRMSWVSDEVSEFFIIFSNDWALCETTEDADEASHNWNLPTKNLAPIWFPRDVESLDKWIFWHSMLSQWTIDANVECKSQKRLHELCKTRDGLCSDDMPLIRATLLGPEWSAALDLDEMSGRVLGGETVKPSRRI